MNFAHYLNTRMRWNGRRVWVNTRLNRMLGVIVLAASGQAADVDLTVLLEGGAVVNVRASEKGRLWDFN